jgi:hypothetical protein
MARQFREQLEEEVQLEQARKAQSTAAPPPAEAPPAGPAPAAPPEPLSGHPATFSHAHAGDDPGADPGASRADPVPSTDERRT